VQFICSNEKSLAQTTIHHDPDDFEVSTAVSGPLTARKALTAIHIGLDTAAITHGNVGYPLTDLQHLDAQLMTRYPRKIEEWKFAEIATDIRSTYAHPMGSNQRIAGGR
jgi:hypothetical protein